MSITIALIGRPNVGKSTLFNRLTKTRDALVLDMPEVTRDRQYGQGKVGDKPYIVIDTGGLYSGLKQDKTKIGFCTTEQTHLAIEEADAILFLVDAREGMTPVDQAIARDLHKLGKAVFFVVNKVDGLNIDLAQADFVRLGFSEPLFISASHGRGVQKLMDVVLEVFPEDAAPLNLPEDENTIKIAVVGRPNVGKSTLINRVLGEERVVVYDQAGTTRDTIEIPFERHKQAYVLMDTAGVRRQSKVRETVEKFSIIKTLQAIERAHVVVFMMDAQLEIATQDLRLLEFIVNAGKSVVMIVNKWDGLDSDTKAQVHSELDRRLNFMDFAALHFISALHGTGVGDIFRSVKRSYQSAMMEHPTGKLTKLLEAAVRAYAPPMVNRRRIKLRYAHLGGKNPPIVVIHGNQAKELPETYQRYLVNFFRKKLKLVGTPLLLRLKSGDNPYEGKKNPLNERQLKKRRRLINHVKKR